jgi:hypothetical protein
MKGLRKKTLHSIFHSSRTAQKWLITDVEKGIFWIFAAAITLLLKVLTAILLRWKSARVED